VPARRFSVTAGFYRTCVIDGLMEHSPAEHVRRPSVPAGSPTLGFTHLQFEALLTAARPSADRCDLALVAMLGLLSLRIFEATGADIADLGARAKPGTAPEYPLMPRGARVVLALRSDLVLGREGWCRDHRPGPGGNAAVS
jgi:hypothetical protein